jgi:uncharacterized protein YceK
MERNRNAMKKLLLVLLVCIPTLGCAGILSDIQAACVAAVPVFAQIQTYVSEADLAVDQAAALEVVLPPDVAASLTIAVDSARVALRVAQAGVQALINLCQSPDIVTAFAEFEKAWSSIEKAIDGATLSGKLKATPSIQPPLIVAIVRKAHLHQ